MRASEPAGEVQETAAEEAALEPAKLAEETEQSATDNASDAAQELSGLAEEMAIEDIETEETAAEDIIIEETATEETTIEETTIEGTTIEDTVIEETTIEDTVIEETTIEETASREDTIPTQETASQEVPDATQETASSEEQISADEIVTEEEPYTTEDITQEETEEDGIAPHIMDFVEIKDIARGSYKNVSWVINKDGRLTVSGYGAYCIYPQHAHTPWYPYREQIKTAVVRLFGVENPSFMFEDCVNLTSVDLSRFDTSYSTNFTAMFSGCKSLKKIDLSGMDTSNATRLNNMFWECSSLEELDLSNFDTSKVMGMDHMFAFDRNLRHIRFGKDFTTVNVKCSLEMFRSCQSLEELDLSGFSMPNNTCMKGMFSGCSNLKKLTFGENFSTEKAEDVRYMFSGCDGLRTLELSTFDLSAAKYTEWMLSSCMPLLELHTPRNVKADIKMPQGIWQTQEGQSVTSGYLPKNQSKSVKLTQQMHLEVTKDVTKYIFGSTLDLSDLEVEYRNSTGSIREQVKDYTTNAKSINMRVAGTKDLIVTYKGLSATVKITVKEQTVLDRFVLDEAKTVYMPGEKPNLDGIWLHGYLGNDRKVLTRNYSTNLDEIDTSTPGVKKLKVWFEDVSGEVDLFVMEPFQDDDIAHKRYDTLAYKIDRNGKLTMMGAEPAQKKETGVVRRRYWIPLKQPR